MNEKQFKLRTMFVGTHGVKEYRDSIERWVNADDIVLEIGCEWGTTSQYIAPKCKELIATDISPDCIERAKQQHPSIRFELLDGFDVRSAIRFEKDFTKIYIDMSGLSGYRSLLDTISLLTMYATVFRPEAMVIKSASLKHFAAHVVPWRGNEGQTE